MMKLKPCPFCGGKVYPVYTSKEKRFYFTHYGGEEKCDIKSFILDPGTKSIAEAYEAWNRRVKE